jgi:hypothetical protein
MKKQNNILQDLGRDKHETFSTTTWLLRNAVSQPKIVVRRPSINGNANVSSTS